MSDNGTIRALLQTLIEDQRLTGFDGLLLDGQPIFEDPGELTEWGGRKVPELDEVRGKHAQLHAELVQLGIPWAPIPTYHVYNLAADGDGRYAESLADASNAYDVQYSFSRRNMLNFILGAGTWRNFIYDLENGRIMYDENWKPRTVDDHAIWDAHATPLDMVEFYQNDIRQMLLNLNRSEGV